MKYTKIQILDQIEKDMENATTMIFALNFVHTNIDRASLETVKEAIISIVRECITRSINMNTEDKQ